MVKIVERVQVVKGVESIKAVIILEGDERVKGIKGVRDLQEVNNI